jgi:proline iminopeptidase
LADHYGVHLKHVTQQIYVMMQVPSEFKTGGRLIHWDRSKDLPQITVRTLMVGARYDTMDPDYMNWMSTQVKQGRYLYCPEGSHLAMWDDEKHFYPGIIGLLMMLIWVIFQLRNNVAE